MICFECGEVTDEGEIIGLFRKGTSTEFLCKSCSKKRF